MNIGLNNGLKPKFGIKNVKHGSDNLEGFLIAVKKKILKAAFKRWRFELSNNKTREIYKVLQRLKQSGSVCVPTDKTNSTRVIHIEDYMWWISGHYLKMANLPLRPKVVALFEYANKLLDKVKIDFSVQEEKFVR